MKKIFKILQVFVLMLIAQNTMAQLNGTYRIGTTPIPGETGSYASFSAAVNALNVNGVSGSCTFYFSDNGATYTEAADVAIGYVGGSLANTVTFKPYTGVTCTLSFTKITAGFVIDGHLVIGAADANAALPASLKSTNFLTIDGSNTIGGSTKDFTIQGATTATTKSVIRIFGDNNNITIKNCVVNNGCTSATTSSPILVTNYFNTVNYTPDNITIQNNTLASVGGTGSSGITNTNSGTPTAYQTNLVIIQNAITAKATRAILVNYVNDGTIANNTIDHNPTGVSGSPCAGILFLTGGPSAGSFNVYGNTFTTLTTANTAAGSGYGIVGIDNQLASPKIANIYNNVIRGFKVNAATVTNTIIYGIRHTGSSTSNVYNNSIYLPELTDMTTFGTSYIAGIVHATTTEAAPSSTGTLIVKNNAIFMDESTMKVWGIRRVGTTATFISDNNVVFTKAGNVAGYFGFFNATDYTTLASWTLASAQDAASYNVNPTFTSATNLTPTTAYPGTYIASVTNDFAGTARDNAPTIGAYEAGTMIGGVWRSTASNPGFASNTNWRDNTVPTIGTDLYIPSGAANYPSLTTTYGCTRLVNYGTINLTGAALLQIQGNIVNNGTITNGSDGVGLTGSTAAQTIFGNGTIGILKVLNTFGASIGINTNDTLRITSVLYPHATGTFTTNGKLILKSTSIANTAVVATGSITGAVQVERYIPAGNRAFRLLAPGVIGSTIKAAWQEGATTASFNPNPGFGTHITGTAGTGGNVNITSGFDETTLGNPSMYTFDNAGLGWTAITNTTSTFTDAKLGYRILIRGDRTLTLITNSSTANNLATTLRNRGTLASGAQVFTLAASDGQYSFAGNPYWAPVNWSTVSKTNLNTNFWIWDPTMTGTNARGAYVAASTGNIQPGQAFFVLNVGGAGALSFAETDRNIAGTLTNTFRTSNTIDGKIIAKLYLQQNYAAGLMADIASTEFSKDYKVTIGKEDAPKFGNPDENISFKTMGSTLSINGTILPSKQDTLWLNMGNMLSKNYVLAIEGKEFINTSNIEAYLVDSYLNIQTTINLNGEVSIPYIIDANLASAAANRFYIVFNANKIILPIATDKLEVKLTPNPATDYVQVNYSAKQKGNTVIRIINNNGQSVTTLNLGEQQAGQFKVPVSKLAAGMYTVELIVGEERTTAKLIKQ